MKTIEFIVTDADIENYAKVSGDYNPVHFDQDYAINHGFSDKIVHGLLTMGKIWSLVSSRFLNIHDFPHSFEMKFATPVYVGDTVKLKVSNENHVCTVDGFCEERQVIKAKIILMK